MRFAILGGTFDPPHCGHLGIARCVLEETDSDRVLFVPTSIPSHKQVAHAASPEQRLAMVRIACDAESGMLVDDCDIRRGGVSYSIDTVADVRDRYDVSGSIGFIIGDDLIEGFSAWHRVDEFVAQVELLVAHRSSSHELAFSYPHRYLHNRLSPPASRDIRKRVQAGLPIDRLVPTGVARYIANERLYLRHETG